MSEKLQSDITLHDGSIYFSIVRWTDRPVRSDTDQPANTVGYFAAQPKPREPCSMFADNSPKFQTVSFRARSAGMPVVGLRESAAGHRCAPTVPVDLNQNGNRATGYPHPAKTLAWKNTAHLPEPPCTRTQTSILLPVPASGIFRGMLFLSPRDKNWRASSGQTNPHPGRTDEIADAAVPSSPGLAGK